MAGRTCINNTLPGTFDRGSDAGRSFFAMPNFPESFAGMTECCKPNKLHVSGKDEFKDCILWCVIPDEILKPDGKNLGEEDEVLNAIKDCVEEKGGFANGTSRRYISSWQVKEDAAAGASSMIGMGGMTLFGVGVWGLLVVGFLVVGLLV